MKRARANFIQVASHACFSLPRAVNIGKDVVGAECGMEVAAEGIGVEVLAPLTAVGRIDGLEVEAFVRQRVVGKGDAGHGKKDEG